MYLNSTNQIPYRPRPGMQEEFPLLKLKAIAVHHRRLTTVARKFAIKALLAEAQSHHLVLANDEVVAAVVEVACAASKTIGDGRAREVAVQTVPRSAVDGATRTVIAIHRGLVVIHEGRI